MELVTIQLLLLILYVYLLGLLSTRIPAETSRGATGDLFFVLLIPALNEEHVIGRTLTSLLALHGNFLILVIDDASDDGTIAAVTPFLSDSRIQLLHQSPELAHRGKGAVLNTGYTAIERLGLVERYGPDQVIVVVFDSDARVDPGFLDAVSPYFRDPRIAGVQSAVRMYNARQNLLTSWQHLEFAIWGTLFCRAKNLLRSATLSGNGQCTRYAALASLGREPWQPSSLAEDLDLSLRLLMCSWQMRFCASVAVWQEAVPQLGPLVRQRSRWLQGHFVCWQYLPGVLRSRLPWYTRLDLVLFLLSPVLLLPIGFSNIVIWGQFILNAGHWTLPNLLGWYLLGFGLAPLVVAAWRDIDRPSPWRIVMHAHLFIFYAFVWLLASVVVVWHVVRGQRGWAKTSRTR